MRRLGSQNEILQWVFLLYIAIEASIEIRSAHFGGENGSRGKKKWMGMAVYVAKIARGTIPDQIPGAIVFIFLIFHGPGEPAAFFAAVPPTIIHAKVSLWQRRKKCL